MKKVFLLITLIFCMASLLLSASAVTISQYFVGVGTAGQGEGYLAQRSYRSYFQMDVFGLVNTIPLFDNFEDEIRLTTNYIPIDIPHTINEGLITSSIYDGTSVADGTYKSVYNFQYGTNVYSVDSPLVLCTNVNMADPYGNSNTIKTANFGILNSNIAVSPSLYMRGMVYGQLINDTTYSFDIVSQGTYNILINGTFSLVNANGELERYGTTVSSSFTGQYRLDPTIVLGSDYITGLVSRGVDISKWVFSGNILVYPNDTDTTIFPSIKVCYDTSYPVIDSMTNYHYDTNVDSYQGLSVDPILRFLTSAVSTGTFDEIDITANGTYRFYGPTIANVDVPQTLGWGGMFDWIFASIGSFMSFEIAPGWSIGILMSIAVSLAVGIWLMRLFMGG